MPENHREPVSHVEPSLLAELGSQDHAADALREVAGLRREQPPEPSPALAAFLVHPDMTAPSPNHEQRRTSPMKVIHLKATRIRRAAAAAGAAVALATVGAAAMAATSDPVTTSVVQADPSDTSSTTTEATETETAEPTETEPIETVSAEPTDTETEAAEPTETSEPSETEASAPATTVNPRAYANHHDGKGADDEHADVRGGGEVDHRAEHQGIEHGDDAQKQEDADDQEQSDEGSRTGGDGHKSRH